MNSLAAFKKPLIVAILIAGAIPPASLALGSVTDPADEPDPPAADSRPMLIGPTDVIVRGFEDPATGQPITCSDGSVLEQTLRGIKVDSGPAADPVTPVCPDGTTPQAFFELRKGWEAQEAVLEDGGDSSDFDDGSFVIEETEER